MLNMQVILNKFSILYSKTTGITQVSYLLQYSVIAALLHQHNKQKLSKLWDIRLQNCVCWKWRSRDWRAQTLPVSRHRCSAACVHSVCASFLLGSFALLSTLNVKPLYTLDNKCLKRNMLSPSPFLLRILESSLTLLQSSVQCPK